jgi:hypothetical protein
VQHRRFRPPRQHVVAFETACGRIGAVAQQRAVEFGQDRAGHGQVDEIGFVGHRRERSRFRSNVGIVRLPVQPSSADGGRSPRASASA